MSLCECCVAIFYYQLCGAIYFTYLVIISCVGLSICCTADEMSYLGVNKSYLNDDYELHNLGHLGQFRDRGGSFLLDLSSMDFK